MSDQLEDVFTRSLPRLGAYGFALTGSYTAAEELVQAAIVKVFTRRRRFRSLAAAEGYLRAAMRTLHVDGLRRQARWIAAMPSVAGPPSVPDASDSVAAADAVGRALVELPPRVRVAIVMHYLDDLPVSAIAQEMRISDGTVKGYLRDGRHRLSVLLVARADEADHEAEVVSIREARRWAS